MHVREAGAGAAILFLHGWSCHGGFFPKQFDELARDFHLLAPDLPGHGLTGTAGPPLSIEAAADTCAELIETRNLRKVLLAGWSMGAAVAWSMLARHGSARIAGLVTVDMSPRPLNDATWQLGLRDGLDLARSDKAAAAMPGAWPVFADRIVQSFFADGVATDPKLAEWARDEIARCDPNAVSTMWRSLTSQDFRPLLPRIECPALITCGARSALYGREVFAWTAAQMPLAHLICFEHSGHAPHLTEPAAFNAAIRAFHREL